MHKNMYLKCQGFSEGNNALCHTMGHDVIKLQIISCQNSYHITFGPALFCLLSLSQNNQKAILLLSTLKQTTAACSAWTYTFYSFQLHHPLYSDNSRPVQTVRWQDKAVNKTSFTPSNRTQRAVIQIPTLRSLCHAMHVQEEPGVGRSSVGSCYCLPRSLRCSSRLLLRQQEVLGADAWGRTENVSALSNYSGLTAVTSSALPLLAQLRAQTMQFVYRISEDTWAM